MWRSRQSCGGAAARGGGRECTRKRRSPAGRQGRPRPSFDYSPDPMDCLASVPKNEHRSAAAWGSSSARTAERDCDLIRRSPCLFFHPVLLLCFSSVCNCACRAGGSTCVPRSRELSAEHNAQLSCTTQQYVPTCWYYLSFYSHNMFTTCS